jgi:hypothetical protein
VDAVHRKVKASEPRKAHGHVDTSFRLNALRQEMPSDPLLFEVSPRAGDAVSQQLRQPGTSPARCLIGSLHHVLPPRIRCRLDGRPSRLTPGCSAAGGAPGRTVAAGRSGSHCTGCVVIEPV